LTYRKVPAQIEQRDLTYFVSGALSTRQAVSEVALTCDFVASGHAPYVHAHQSIGRNFGHSAITEKYYGTTKRFAKPDAMKSGTCLQLPGLLRQIMLKMG
jgi:hypothetical protein